MTEHLHPATVDIAVTMLRRETEDAPGPGAVAVSLRQLLDELRHPPGVNPFGLAPATADGLLALIDALCADPRVDLVTDCRVLEFVWSPNGGVDQVSPGADEYRAGP